MVCAHLSLCTLDALAAAALFVVVTVVGTHVLLVLGLRSCGVEVLKEARLHFLGLFNCLPLAREQALQLLCNLGVQLGRVVDVELDNEIALDEGVAMHGHALLLDHLGGAIGEHCAGLGADVQDPAIEVLDGERDAGESFLQGYLLAHKEVVALASELGVVLDFDDEDDVPRLDARCLIAFAVELDLLVVACPLVDGNFEDLALLLDLLALALLAPLAWVDHLALAAALVAGTLDLLHHARAQLPHFDHHTMAITAGAHGLAARFAATATAGLAEDVAVDGELADLAVVAVRKANLQGMHHVLALARSATATATAATEHVEDISGAATTAALLHGLLATLIVEPALVVVAEHLVGLLDLLEELLVATAVRMVLHRFLAEGLLDF